MLDFLERIMHNGITLTYFHALLVAFNRKDADDNTCSSTVAFSVWIIRRYFVAVLLLAGWGPIIERPTVRGLDGYCTCLKPDRIALETAVA